MILLFIFNSILLGVGLAMDAFSVSLANGLNEPEMKAPRMCAIAGTFAGFQALMPMLGWICVNTVVYYFNAFESVVPWIALILLLVIGVKMIAEAIGSRGAEKEKKELPHGTLIVQGIATSIDALSVGFAISEYSTPMAIVCAAIIAVVTFIICIGGLAIGKRFGMMLSGKATILGGIILILIGIEIFITSFF
jgi:putative Mn2+ efflux pump MntP